MFRLVKQISRWALPVIFLNCCSSDQNIKSIATVGDHFVSIEEFQLTYQFNPYLVQIKDANQAKRLLLRTLIAQKLIASEGYAKQIDKIPTISRLIEQYHREALIESLWDEKITRQIHLSDKEIYEAYLQSKSTRFFQYILFDDIQDATSAYEQLQGGATFLQIAALNGLDPESIPSDSISFGSDLVEIEKAVFQLALNESSTPVKTGQYYIIVKPFKEKSDVFTSETDFLNNYKRLAKILRKRKQRKYFDRLIKSQFDKPPYQIDKTAFKQLVQSIERRIDFKHVSTKENQDIATEEIYQEATKSPNHLKNDLIITFKDGNQWTVGELLSRLQVGPYPIELTTPGKFRISMIAATKMTLDDQILVDLSLAEGLDKSSNVLIQTAMWKDYIVYQSMVNNLLKNQTDNDSLQTNKEPLGELHYLDMHLTNLAKKYKIHIHTDLLDTLTLSKSDMVVMKTHFPKRTLAPVIQPFLNLPNFDYVLTALY